jgi:hypothetical protein
MLLIAKRLCRFLAKYSSIIKVTYPSNAALAAALTAAEIACSVLASELELVKEWGD